MSRRLLDALGRDGKLLAMKGMGIADKLVAAAEASGCDDLSGVRTSVEDALAGNFDVIDRLLDAELVEEESFFRSLAEQLGIDWEPDPEPDTEDARELKRLCGAQVSIRHRILPLRIL
ncbi:MAG: hypothetical protein KDM63_21700, partial [Verrucomicrobiae bacterium]|nr:hypothetical protein [Verrucomicrobiae bacterium]